MKGAGDVMPTWLIPIILKLMALLTPQLKNMLGAFAITFYKSAKETENPFDDIAAGLILALLSIPTPKS